MIVLLFLAACLLLGVARLIRRLWRSRENQIRYLEVENARQKASIEALHRALASNNYGSGINLCFHIRNIRRIGRILTDDGDAMLERTPEIAWWLRAMDDYLLGVGQVFDPFSVKEAFLPDYRMTYEPLAHHIEKADI